jgi:hypothetical protein
MHRVTFDVVAHAAEQQNRETHPPHAQRQPRLDIIPNLMHTYSLQ